MRVPTVVVCAALLLSGSTGQPAHAVDGSQPRHYWRWSDGSDARARIFAEGRYRVPARLPRLVVSTDPATAGRVVRLQYADGGTWRTEDSARTDNTGSVALELNPYCPDGRWCTRSYAYRVLVDDVDALFRITFAR